MKYQHYDLGYCQGGQVVEVTLRGNAANVRLLDDSNFQSYRSGRRHTYYGGHYRQSPARIKIPSAGNWNITVDLGGYAGHVESSVRMLS